MATLLILLFGNLLPLIYLESKIPLKAVNTVYSEKLRYIIEYLAEIEDESIIQQIENLLKPKLDFWEELSDEEKAVIKKGYKDMEEGRRIPYEEFISKYRSGEK